LSDDSTEVIHGNKWKRADIAPTLDDCRQYQWHQQQWGRRDELSQKHGGTSSPYVGQSYDSTKVDLVRGGWTHDHCEICWWKLFETQDIEHSVGYSNGHGWICRECFERFIQ